MEVQKIFGNSYIIAINDHIAAYSQGYFPLISFKSKNNWFSLVKVWAFFESLHMLLLGQLAPHPL